MTNPVPGVVAEIGAGTWPDWIAAIGTAAALLVAAFSYRHSVVLRREAQARLIYSQSMGVEYLAPEAIVHFPEDEVQFAQSSRAVEAREVGSFNQVISYAKVPVVKATLAVFNGSSEVVGPVKIQAVDLRDGSVFSESAIVIDVIPPNNNVVVSFAVENPYFPGGYPVGATVIFRDTSGKWWRRHTSRPIESVHNDPENTAPTVAEREEMSDLNRLVGIGMKPYGRLSFRTRWHRAYRKFRGKNPIP